MFDFNGIENPFSYSNRILLCSLSIVKLAETSPKFLSVFLFHSVYFCCGFANVIILVLISHHNSELLTTFLLQPQCHKLVRGTYFCIYAWTFKIACGKQRKNMSKVCQSQSLVAHPIDSSICLHFSELIAKPLPPNKALPKFPILQMTPGGSAYIRSSFALRGAKHQCC